MSTVIYTDGFIFLVQCRTLRFDGFFRPLHLDRFVLVVTLRRRRWDAVSSWWFHVALVSSFGGHIFLTLSYRRPPFDGFIRRLHVDVLTSTVQFFLTHVDGVFLLVTFQPFNFDRYISALYACDRYNADGFIFRPLLFMGCVMVVSSRRLHSLTVVTPPLFHLHCRSFLLMVSYRWLCFDGFIVAVYFWPLLLRRLHVDRYIWRFHFDGYMVSFWRFIFGATCRPLLFDNFWLIVSIRRLRIDCRWLLISCYMSTLLFRTVILFGFWVDGCYVLAHVFFRLLHFDSFDTTVSRRL